MNERKPLSIAALREWMEAELGVSRSTHTVRDWIVKGVDGVRLEATWAGKGWMSTPEAVRRFLRNLTEMHAHRAGVTVTVLRL